MKLLLDQGLPRSTILHLSNAGIESTHVGNRGLATASDAEILELGGKESSVVVTLDADSHAILALSGAAKPSVIRVRIEGLRSEQLGSAGGSAGSLHGRSIEDPWYPSVKAGSGLGGYP